MVRVSRKEIVYSLGEPRQIIDALLASEAQRAPIIARAEHVAPEFMPQFHVDRAPLSASRSPPMPRS